MNDSANDKQFYRVVINAPIERVWEALTKQGEVLPFFFGSVLHTTGLAPGAPIRMRTPDEKYTAVVGEVLEIDPPHRYAHTFKFTQFDDPLCKVTYELKEVEGGVEFTLISENVPQGVKTEGLMKQGGDFIPKTLKVWVEKGKPTFTARMIMVMGKLMSFMTPAACRSENWPLDKKIESPRHQARPTSTRASQKETHMPKSPEEMAAAMIANLVEKTGKKIDQWLTIVAKTKLAKHGEIIKHLKSEHGVTHGYANMIAHEYLKQDEPATPDDDLVDAQYAGPKAGLRPIYDKLLKEMAKFGKDVEIAPKKAYVSIRRSKQFALIQPSTKTRVDVGIQLKGDDATDRLEKSGSFNAMVSHRVRLADIKDVDKELIGWLKEAFKRA